MNALPSARSGTQDPRTRQAGPVLGELWSIHGRQNHAIFLGEGLWNVLVCINDEYTLKQESGLEPASRAHEQPAGFHWADQFDALAAADGLRITWAEEILTYQVQGWDKIRKRRPQAVS